MIEYGTATLNTASESIFKKFEVFQATATKTVFGLPEWVPNILLRMHAGFLFFMTESAS